MIDRRHRSIEGISAISRTARLARGGGRDLAVGEQPLLAGQIVAEGRAYGSGARLLERLALGDLRADAPLMRMRSTRPV